MDKRAGLPAGYKLDFPGMSCTVEEEVGRGVNTIVYRGWYSDAYYQSQRHDILVKEFFPVHETGAIVRNMVDQCICFEEAGPAWEIGRERFFWGNEIHLELRRRYPEATRGNLNTFAYRNTYYTILEDAGGRTLEQDANSGKDPVPLYRVILRWLGILDALRRFHRMGYLHLGICPDHVLLFGQGRNERVELIGYSNVFRMDDEDVDLPLCFHMKPGFVPPELNGRTFGRLGPWTDLYSVAALFYDCLMGRPLSEWQQANPASAGVDTSLYLQGEPAAVIDGVQKMLMRGLSLNMQERYQTVEEMERDFLELSERMDRRNDGW